MKWINSAASIVMLQAWVVLYIKKKSSESEDFFFVVKGKELSLNNLHPLPCLFFRLLRQKASAMPASPAFFFLHSKKHPAEIAQVIFRQFLTNQ